MTTEIDNIPNIITADIPITSTSCNEELKTISIEEQSLLNWINLHFSIATIQQLKDIPTLVLFIQSIFFQVPSLLSYTSNEEYNPLQFISLLLNEINLIIPVDTILPQNIIDVSAYLNGDQNQIMILLGIIQTQYQAYTITHNILKNEHLSFTSIHVS
jgi:hypothetical protein